MAWLVVKVGRELTESYKPQRRVHRSASDACTYTTVTEPLEVFTLGKKPFHRPDIALCLNDILQLLLGFRQRRFRLVDVFHLDKEITRMLQALLDHLDLNRLMLRYNPSGVRTLD